MAKVTYGPAVSEARGKAADTVYTRARGGAVLRALRVPAPPVTTHNLLSATHLDTTPATPPTRGDLVSGQDATPLWKRLAKGTSGQLLGCDASDVKWVNSPTPLKAVQTADVTVLGNAAESTILSLTGSATIPANSAAIGTTYRVVVMGYQGVGPTGAQNYVLKLYLGATLVYTGATVAQRLGAAKAFHMEFLLTFRSIGNPGTVNTQGRGHSFSAAATVAFLDNIAGDAAPVNINTTVDQVIDVKVLWSAPAHADNKFCCTNATIERLAL